MAFTTLTIDGFVGTLTLDPPPGGIDRAFVDALVRSAEEVAAATDRIYVLVVTSVGPDLAAGWSADALAEGEGPDALVTPLGAGCDALAAVPQPTVVAVRGRAHSIGLELALACDIRVAAENATFAMPETAHGLVPRAGGTQRLPRAIGRPQALRLLLTGEAIDAREAHRIGLVTSVVADAEVEGAAHAIAQTIAQRGPIATRFAKEAVLRGAELPLQQALRAELDLTIILQSTADRAEGVRAFVERRPPRFTGQ